MSVYGFKALIATNQQMDILSYLRIVGVAVAFIVVCFNLYLLYYFGKMFKFLFSMMGQTNQFNNRIAFSMYLVFVFFYVTYLIDQYLFQYVQYAIVSVLFLANPRGKDDEKIENWGKIVFKDPALLAYRIMYHI